MADFEGVLGTGAELDAVNDVLASIGEPPVSTLEGESNSDVANARRILNKINREIQAKGWTFNIDESMVLTPDTFTKLIDYSPLYLSIMATSGTSVYINRGGYLYDRTNKTDQFDSPVTVRGIVLKDYEEMPACFRGWIVAKASRQFNSRFFGAPDVGQDLAEEEATLRMACMEYEMDYGQYNMLDGDNFVAGQMGR